MRAGIWLIVFTGLSMILVSCSSASGVNGPLTARDILAETGQTEWDMLIIGDSDMDVSPMFYSKYFEEDLGIKIKTHRITLEPTLAELPDYLGDPELRKQISEAEIIIFNIPIVRPSTGGACFDPTKNLAQDGCFDSSIDELVEITRRIIQEMKSLVGEHGAMIRIQNNFVPTEIWLGKPGSEGLAHDCLECFADYWGAQAEIAAEEGIPVVDVFTLFHGADHKGDPYQKGYIGSDQLHVNRPGAEQIAKLYRRVGYQYWMP